MLSIEFVIFYKLEVRQLSRVKPGIHGPKSLTDADKEKFVYLGPTRSADLVVRGSLSQTRCDDSLTSHLFKISDSKKINLSRQNSSFIHYYGCESSSSQGIETSQTPRKIDLRMINQKKFKILSRKHRSINRFYAKQRS